VTLQKSFSRPSFSYFVSTPPIKLNLGLQKGGRLLIATHLDQSIYLANQKQGAVNKYDLTVFIRVSPDLLRGSERCAFLRSRSSLPLDPLDMTAAPHPRFPLRAGGDALTYHSKEINNTSLEKSNVRDTLQGLGFR